MLDLLAMPESMRILIAPLNWGLGHATRCIPLIKSYLNEGWEVILASDGDARSLLQAEFPLLECHELPGYGITYPRSGNAMVISMASQIPRLSARITQEKKWLENFLKEHPQDLILSDSRYGMYSSDAHSVVICHQTKIKSPSMEGMLNSVHARLLNRFDELWIPDDENRTLSGDLSRLELKIPIKFIGAISRFNVTETVDIVTPILAVLSGPEPQRTMFEDLLTPVLRKIEGAILIRGVMNDHSDEMNEGLRVIGHLLRDEIEAMINAARMVVCRSGYSSIMDLHALNKRAILVPTPGQTEQEYLAARLHENGLFVSMKQEDILGSLGNMIETEES